MNKQKRVRCITACSLWYCLYCSLVFVRYLHVLTMPKTKKPSRGHCGCSLGQDYTQCSIQPIIDIIDKVSIRTAPVLKCSIVFLHQAGNGYGFRSTGITHPKPTIAKEVYQLVLGELVNVVRKGLIVHAPLTWRSGLACGNFTTESLVVVDKMQDLAVVDQITSMNVAVHQMRSFLAFEDSLHKRVKLGRKVAEIAQAVAVVERFPHVAHQKVQPTSCIDRWYYVRILYIDKLRCFFACRNQPETKTAWIAGCKEILGLEKDWISDSVKFIFPFFEGYLEHIV